MHKRKRGKWVFIDMINGGGLIALLTRFTNGVFNEGGGLLFRLHFYPDKHGKHRININENAQSHDQDYNVMFMVTLCWQFHFKRSALQSHLHIHSKFEFK